MARKSARKKTMQSKSVNTYRGRKKQSTIVRAPFVECKKNQDPLVSEYLSEGNFSTFLPVSTFTRMNRGVEDDQFIGDSVFSKYLSMKLNFKFPNGTYVITKPYRIQVIHGWMTAPFALDTSGLYGPNKLSVSRAELDAIVAARVGPEFNQAVDRMNFRTKTKKIFRVEGKQWITADRDDQLNTPHLVSNGGPADAFTQLNWAPMRKINLIDSSDTNSSLPPSPFSYPNEGWIPFVCIYTPDKDNISWPEPTAPRKNESRVKIEEMNCHWYTDS